jgi:hypothetical protein
MKVKLKQNLQIALCVWFTTDYHQMYINYNIYTEPYTRKNIWTYANE